MPGFWDGGHKIFRSTPETFPVKFLAGDVFDPTFFAPGPVITAENSVSGELPAVDLTTLTSLTPLRGTLSVIHADHFIHLFSEARQRELAYALASLLSPALGSFLFGKHAAREDSAGSGIIEFEVLGENAQRITMFCHCPASWRALWEEVFGVGKVDVQAYTEKVERKDFKKGLGDIYLNMVWSVKRL
jgi:hypothetical protein